LGNHTGEQFLKYISLGNGPPIESCKASPRNPSEPLEMIVVYTNTRDPDGSDDIIYRTAASRIYDVPLAQVTVEQRRAAMAAVLGLGYGAAPAKEQNNASK
jgi:hypothetical protein